MLSKEQQQELDDLYKDSPDSYEHEWMYRNNQ